MDKLTLPVTPTDVSSVTDLAGLARLKAEAATQSPESIEKVAQQFEALFLEMMLKSMRDANLGEGIFDNDGSQMYLEMFDKQISLQLAQSDGKGLGIAELLTRQLSRRNAADANDTDVALPIGKESGAAMPVAWKPASPEEFVREILPHARKAAAALNVNPLGLVAQAAVETGWGQHVVSGNDGANSMNLFGIKAGEEWGGDKAVARTLEFKDGLPVAQQASFRRYGSIAESFSDYVNLLSNSPRYREVLEKGQDLQAFAEALGRSGYATDPDYARKIKGVLSGDTLQSALLSLDPGLKPADPTPMT